jgi:hypothetical protein
MLMKKFLNVLLLVCVLFSFVACGNGNKLAEDAAKEVEVQKQVDDLKEQVSKLKDEQDGVVHKPLAEKAEEKAEKVEDKNIKTDDKTTVKTEVKAVEEATSSIIVSSPKDGSTISLDPVTFSGTVSEGATKIVVTANAGTKNEDVYTLAGFKAGDKKFSYKASKSFANMVSGSNSYVFTAHFKDGTTKTTSLKINFSK